MPRKKNQRAIWPVHLPAIQRHIITSLKSAAQEDPTYAEDHKANARLLADAELWWVAKPMAILASHAKEDLPAGQTLADNRPSLAGVIVYEGGTGITTAWEDAPAEHIKTSAFGQKIYPQVEIQGLTWVRGMLLGLTDTPLVPRQSKNDPLFIVPLSPTAQAHLEKLLVTTWLLSEQPHIGVSHPYTGEHGPNRGRKPSHEGQIRIVKLRETPTHPEPWESEARQEGKKWAMQHRTVVSGHWRRQPYGPGLASKKLIYIEPYLKGPSGAPIIMRPTVKVWSR